jgi:hypothetical protein
MAIPPFLVTSVSNRVSCFSYIIKELELPEALFGEHGITDSSLVFEYALSRIRQSLRDP